MKRSLRDRLSFALGVTAFLSVVVTAVVSVGLLRNVAERNARVDLQRIARAFARQADTLDIPAGQLPTRRALLNFMRVLGDELAVVRRGGAVNALTANGDAIAVAVDVAAVVGGREITGSVKTTAGSFVYIGVPVTGALGGGAAARPIRAVILAAPAGVSRGLALSIALRVLLAGIVAVLLAIVASRVIARRLIRPVSDLSHAAARIAHGDLSTSVPVSTDDEIGELARSFNDMAVGLSEAQRREREFLASVSHELRTPITAIRGYAEAIDEGAVKGTKGRAEAVGIIRAEADRLERMVHDVMDLARVGSPGFKLERARVDLTDTLRDAVAAHRAEAADAHVTLTADSGKAVVVQTDDHRVRQIVSNLVQNALRVTPAGGRVDVRARAIPNGVEIEVADTGPGIAREDLPHVFERSYLWRASKGSRPVGTGLGLAIVRELVGALSGRVEVFSEDGRGTVFRITLPAAIA